VKREVEKPGGRMNAFDLLQLFALGLIVLGVRLVVTSSR
jgi:hypothetical protein